MLNKVSVVMQTFVECSINVNLSVVALIVTQVPDSQCFVYHSYGSDVEESY